VKPYQEGVVKVKNFLPPKAPEPEIHILEISEELLRNASSLGSLVLSDELSDSQVFKPFLFCSLLTFVQLMLLTPIYNCFHALLITFSYTLKDLNSCYPSIQALFLINT
jgi:hypothetical protein